MARVENVMEKFQGPLYDSVSVDGGQQIGDVEKSGTLKFFVNVQGKTKLETNLQSASLLPHYNTFEARAMRVVISDLPPEYPADENQGPLATTDDVEVSDPDGRGFAISDSVVVTSPPSPIQRSLPGSRPRLTVSPDCSRKQAKATTVPPSSTWMTTQSRWLPPTAATSATRLSLTRSQTAGGTVVLYNEDLEDMNDGLKTKAIPKEQLDPNNGSGTIIGKLIYNTVTTLYVGEKQMISMPTWFFPAGAGPYSETGKFTTHGEPSPNATFRFAEPVYIDKQQNFRVEIEIPDTDTLKDIQQIYGPMNIWVVLDGYMTRDVQ